MLLYILDKFYILLTNLYIFNLLGFIGIEVINKTKKKSKINLKRYYILQLINVMLSVTLCNVVSKINGKRTLLMFSCLFMSHLCHVLLCFDAFVCKHVDNRTSCNNKTMGLWNTSFLI